MCIRDSLANKSRVPFIEVTDSGVPVTAMPFDFDGATDGRFELDTDLVRGDLQYMHEHEVVSFVVGASARFEEVEGKDTGTVSDTGVSGSTAFLLGSSIGSEDDISQNSQRVYAYSTWHVLPSVDINAGVVYSRIELSDNALAPPFIDDTYTEEEVSPKAGFTFSLTPQTHLRGSYGQTLDRTERGGIGSIEPTFVGGFNQVFDGVRGSKQEFYGIGLDHSFSRKTFIGVNYQRREIDLNIPKHSGGISFDRDTLVSVESLFADMTLGKADVDSIGAYVYHVATDNIALMLDYSWEFFKEGEPFPETETVRVQPEVRYFQSDGVFTFTRATWRYQERGGDLDSKERHDFWIVDAGLGYELDNREGAVQLTLNNIFDRSYKYAAITDENSFRPDFGATLDFTFNF